MFGNILAIDKEFKIKLQSLIISADSFIKNNYIYMTLGLKFI